MINGTSDKNQQYHTDINIILCQFQADLLTFDKPIW